MSVGTMFALAGAMAVLAAIPSVSVLAVTARSAASGFPHGMMTSLGIVVGDIILILVAILGLSMLAEAMGPAFSLVKYLGAAYLVWLGLTLWRSTSPKRVGDESANSTLTSSFVTGLLITLGDQKAIFFYLGFFPAFLDLSIITMGETVTVILITLVAVGGVKLIYAYLADRARDFVGPGTGRIMNRLAAGVMIAVGVALVLRA